MEFNFETPLILRLRKIAHSKTVLWCGIVFALIPVTILMDAVDYFLRNSRHTTMTWDFFVYPFFYFILPNLLLSCAFFTVYISARNKDNVLPTGGFTAAGILSVLAGTLIIAQNFYYGVSGIAESFFINIFNGGGLPSKYSTVDMYNMNVVFVALTVTLVLFFFTLSASFFTVASVARNNKPKKFLPILLAIVSFVIFAFYLFFIVNYIISGGFYQCEIRPFVKLPHARIEVITSYLYTFILPAIAAFLCGCMGIGFAKASRRIK